MRQLKHQINFIPAHTRNIHNRRAHEVILATGYFRHEIRLRALLMSINRVVLAYVFHRNSQMKVQVLVVSCEQ